MSKRLRILCLLLGCLLCLSGCYRLPEVSESAVSTLAPAVIPYEAPTGVESESYTAVVGLYLPALSGQRLLCQYVPLELNHEAQPAETVVRALLAFRANSEVTSLGGPVALSLYGEHPVEVAGGICTVSLGSSVLQLDQSRMYTVCLGLAATLCQLDGIHSVNVLVADQAVGMDITNNLPLGLVTAHPGEELSVLWTQLDAKKAPLGEAPESHGLSASAALYFPLANAAGFVAESRTITFPGQNPRQLAVSLLTELSAGPAYVSGTAPMPDLNLLMTAPPEVTDLRTGGRVVTLRFPADLQTQLAEAGGDMACLLSAVVYTIASFVPSVTGVEVYAGNTLLRRLYNTAYGVLSLQNGRMSRNQFSGFLQERVQICLRRGDLLTAVNRWVPAGQSASLIRRLMLLSEGPTPQEADGGLEAVLPVGLTEADVLGLRIDGDMLLVNLSGSMAEQVRGGGMNERLLCYSMVNTLCSAKSLRRVLFFWNGWQADSLAGEIYWSGEFLYSPGLNEGNRG